MVCLGAVTKSPRYSERALKDKVTGLPGMLSGQDFNMFSGYVMISNTKALFYWFIESENDPANDPVVLWTNGGPGCSGLIGFLTEQGPFSVRKDQKLWINPYRWNLIANMIFFEQPVEVGYSWTSEETNFSDQLAAEDNADFIEGWFDLFPQYKSNPFYISSESYGGHYMPQLSIELLSRITVPNFKGMLVGNPYVNQRYNLWGFYRTAAGQNMIPKPEWDRYNDLDCYPEGPQADGCKELANKFDTYLEGTYKQGLDFPICLEDSTGRAQRPWILAPRARASGKSIANYFPKNYQPCAQDYATTYLNREDVRSALHVTDQSAAWAMCSDDVSNKWPPEDVARNTAGLYDELVQSNLIKVMVYSGDDDSACLTSATQKWLWGMNWTITEEWRSWRVNDQVAGYIVKFNGMSFMTVHGAGHLVPQTRPEFALEVFRGYLNGTWF